MSASAAARHDRHIHVRTVEKILQNAAVTAGILKPVKVHTLRHSFATHLLETPDVARVVVALYMDVHPALPFCGAVLRAENRRSTGTVKPLSRLAICSELAD
ncbi:MAG: tyrosine-type recombinase/integrase [Gemmatimonadota bacterium]